MQGLQIVGLIVVFLIATQSRVLAYTDPGSGTLIWQLLVAASLGLMFYLRRILLWFRSLTSRRSEDVAGALPGEAEDSERL